jgi:hypothetical protein
VIKYAAQRLLLLLDLTPELAPKTLNYKINLGSRFYSQLIGLLNFGVLSLPNIIYLLAFIPWD